MFGVSRFQNKVAVVAGAEHPLGAALCTRLASFGATVVAIGVDDLALRTLASRDPSKIEPLAMQSGWDEMLRLLKEAWEDQPIHLYVDILPLMDAATHDPGMDRFSRSAGLTSALKGGMSAGRAFGVMAIPSDQDTPEDRAARTGYKTLLQRFSSENSRARMAGVSLPSRGQDWTRERVVSATDMILMLCHPVSRGVKPGMVIDWALELR